MKKLFLGLFFLVLLCSNLFAQTEPSILSSPDTKAWYVAESEYMTLISGNHVDEWADKSGNNYNLWQPSSPLDYRPTFSGDSVVFDTYLDQLENLDFVLSQPITVYLVFKRYGYSGGYHEIVDFDDINIYEYLDGDSISWGIRSVSDGGKLNASSSNKVPKHKYVVLTATFNGTSSSVRINTNTPDIGGTVNASINAVRLLLSHNELNGSVKELIVRGIDDSDSNEISIIQWLMNKHGISDSSEKTQEDLGNSSSDVTEDHNTFGDIGGDYYVSVYGDDDNPGTYDQPFATWQRAIDVAMPGDTVYIRGGVYLTTEPTRIDPEYWKGRVGYCGTKENPICYFGYPGEWPILDCRYHCDSTEIKYNSALTINYAEHLYFKDFEIRNVYQCSEGVNGAISTGYSRNLTFEHIILHDIGQRGFYMNGGAWITHYNDGDTDVYPYWDTPEDTTRFINCDVYNLCDSISPTPGNAADAWKTIHYRGNYISWEGCRAWNYTDDAIDPSLVNGGEWRINQCWAMPGMNEYEYFGDKKMEHNGFKLSSTPYYDPPNSVHMGTVSNCVAAFAHGGFGTLEKNKPRGNFLFYNNTAYYCVQGYGGTGVGTKDNPRTAIYKNNLEYKSTDISAIGGSYGVVLMSDPGLIYPESHNTWDVKDGYPDFQITDSVTVTDDDFVSIDSLEIISQLTAPRKSDGSLPDITVFQLAEGSDLIDAGTYVGLPYNGTAPDIGAFEFGKPIIANQSPKIGITSPVNESLLEESVNSIKIEVEVSDADGEITLVEYYCDNIKIGQSSSSPWAFQWDNIPSGTSSLKAIATDNLNAKTASSVITVTKNTAVANVSPVISITSPSNETVLEASVNSVNIEVEVSDSDGEITLVEYYNDEIKIGQSSSFPWAFQWTGVPLGNSFVKAIATDNNNAKTTSSTIKITKPQTVPPNNIVIKRTSNNPTKRLFAIFFDYTGLNDITVNIINLQTSESSHYKTISPQKVSNKIVIDFIDFPTGNYKIEITDGGSLSQIPVSKN
ncbi:Ig-like domain-containing protein [Plebeiibacterium marinum]|uniref:Ig-like domain-containing protein n=1 Tax=Plebeiibacterium marinum TaxID=2992111 RepID=A0AAE3SI65_9BACT|nr:Ig-like domain-containing protein [Plebeiobacterium marinum]MCW3804128.1 Ig-like domain-containing protein [Plebeiobacterium marinum]